MLILKYRIKINFKQKKNKEHSIHTDRFSIQNLLFKNVVRDSSERKEEKNEFSPLRFDTNRCNRILSNDNLSEYNAEGVDVRWTYREGVDRSDRK